MALMSIWYLGPLPRDVKSEDSGSNSKGAGYRRFLGGPMRLTTHAAAGNIILSWFDAKENKGP
jgi:hypothetical protein